MSECVNVNPYMCELRSGAQDQFCGLEIKQICLIEGVPSLHTTPPESEDFQILYLNPSIRSR